MSALGEQLTEEQILAIGELSDSISEGLEVIQHRYNLRQTPARMAGPGYYTIKGGKKSNMRGGNRSCDDWRVNYAVNAFMIVLASGIGLSALLKYMSVFGFDEATKTFFQALLNIIYSLDTQPLMHIKDAIVSGSISSIKVGSMAVGETSNVLISFLKPIALIAPGVGFGAYALGSRNMNEDLEKTLEVINAQLENLQSRTGAVTRSVNEKIMSLKARSEELKQLIMEKARELKEFAESDQIVQSTMRSSYNKIKDMICKLIDLIRGSPEFASNVLSKLSGPLLGTDKLAQNIGELLEKADLMSGGRRRTRARSYKKSRGRSSRGGKSGRGGRKTKMTKKIRKNSTKKTYRHGGKKTRMNKTRK